MWPFFASFADALEHGRRRPGISRGAGDGLAGDWVARHPCASRMHSDAFRNIEIDPFMRASISLMNGGMPGD